MKNSIRNPKYIIFIWLTLYVSIGLFGFIIGMEAIIPGPTSLRALLDNEGERVAIENNLAPTDGFLILITKKNNLVSNSYFEKSIKELIEVLKNKKDKINNQPLFGLIQSSEETFSIDKNKFISSDETTRLVIASGKIPVYESPLEFLDLPEDLKKWQLVHPEFDYGYLSNSTGENEVFKLVQRDLDRSLIYTTPLTIIILLWAFRSLLSAIIPLVIAGISLVGSLGVCAILSHVIDGISVTASQLIVLLVLAIGVDYSLFFITRAREEKARGLSISDALLNTKKSTGIAIIWSGLIVAVSLFGLLLIKDTVLNSMAIVSIIAVFMTLLSCIVVLPNILQIFSKCLDTNMSKQANEELYLIKLINISLFKPKLVLFVLIGFLGLLSFFSIKLNLGNTMLPKVLPKSLQGMATYSRLEEKFPDLAGGDASLILKGSNLENLEDEGVLHEKFEELNKYGLRGPFRVEKKSDYTLARYKFLLNGLGDDKISQNLVRELRDKIIPSLFNPLGLDSYFSGVVEHSVSEADKYKSKMPLLFLSVLFLSFLFLLVAFRSIIIPLKAILLNLLSTTASFGVLVLIFQLWESGPFYIGVIESFVPPLLFTILFGLSMDYHVFMLSRISEEYHRNNDTRESVKQGIFRTSKTITSAALIMISVFFVAATLELPVMRQLGIGLGVAVLIDATLIRAMLLPASMVLLGRLNWYLPKFLNPLLKFFPEIKI